MILRLCQSSEPRIAGDFDFQAKLSNQINLAFCSKRRRTSTTNLRRLNARPAAVSLPDRLEPRCLNSTVPAQDRNAVQQRRRRNYAVGEIRNRFTRHFHHFHRNPFVERDAPQNGRFYDRWNASRRRRELPNSPASCSQAACPR